MGAAIFGGMAGVSSVIIKIFAYAFGTSLTDQLTDITIFGESWNWAEFLLSGALTFALVFGLGSIPALKNIGSRFQDRIVPPDARGSSWNGFQRMAKNTPLLKNLSTSQRGWLWEKVVSGRLSATPRFILSSLLKLPLPSADTDKGGPGANLGPEVQFELDNIIND